MNYKTNHKCIHSTIYFSFLLKVIFNNKSKHEWKMHEVAFPSISFNPSMITPACILNSWIRFTDFSYALTEFRYLFLFELALQKNWNECWFHLRSHYCLWQWYRYNDIIFRLILFRHIDCYLCHTDNQLINVKYH